VGLRTKAINDSGGLGKKGIVPNRGLVIQVGKEFVWNKGRGLVMPPV
jgi:hypothetical protein